jgi:tetrahydromethanopterin S-methyltransferase subunit G
MPELSWLTLAAGILTAATLAGGLVIAWIRWQLAGDFARTADVSALGVRIGAVEERLKSMPEHDDLEVLNQRLGKVERSVDVVATELRGVRESIARIERDLHLLIRHHLGPPQ